MSTEPWMVLVTAPNQIIAEVWAEFLQSQGLPCRVHPGDVSGFLGLKPYGVRLLTQEPYIYICKKLLHVD